mgnify:CR=1 FL=1
MYSLPRISELRESTENGNHKFTVVSTFAGGGGSSIGYRMAGGKVLAINEFIPEAVNTYTANWPSTKVLSNDVRDITAQDILSICDIREGELDIFDGSPPCSAFSSLGKRDKGWGKTKKYSDSAQENVEDLFFEYIRLLRGVMPKVFVAENVSGLAKGVAKGYLNEILKGLKGSGYVVNCKILDARYLGVPQSRSRTIFIGIRNDIWLEKFRGRVHPAPFDNVTTLAEAFEGLEFTAQDKAQTNISKYAIYPRLKALKKAEQDTKYFNLIKASPHRCSPCITATTGNIGAAKPCHWENRAFSVSEVKRIMSVPDDYVLTGSYSQQVERLGRMVAPLMMKAVAKNLQEIGVINGNT